MSEDKVKKEQAQAYNQINRTNEIVVEMRSLEHIGEDPIIVHVPRDCNVKIVQSIEEQGLAVSIYQGIDNFLAGKAITSEELQAQQQTNAQSRSAAYSR